MTEASNRELLKWVNLISEEVSTPRDA